MAGQFQGKVALVTGGSSGIGRASALAFAREGAKVVVVADVNVAGGQETVKLIKEANGEATFIQADVSKAADVESMVNKTVEIYGRLDYAHNNAGIAVPGPRILIHEATEEQWDIVIRVNLKSVWLCMKYEILYMSNHGGGVIVNTSSLAGIQATPKNPLYAASKHGVSGLTKSAALKYIDVGIRVNEVCPGPTRTPLKPRDEKAYKERGIRLNDPEDVAQAVVWLCSDAAIAINGHSLPIDGGSPLALSQLPNPTIR